jgi:hypothetical protein
MVIIYSIKFLQQTKVQNQTNEYFHGLKNIHSGVPLSSTSLPQCYKPELQSADDKAFLKNCVYIADLGSMNYARGPVVN